MRVGEQLDVVIEKGVFRGRGLARHLGQVVLVQGGYPGERWRVRVREAARDFGLADGEELLEDVGVRRPSPCPHFPECGGCAHQDLAYPAQLRLKQAVVEDALGRAALHWEGEIQALPSPEEGWRTRASLHLARVGGSTRLGFKTAASHHVVDAVRCVHLAEETRRTVAGLKEALDRRPAVAAHVRRVELAESGDGRHRVAALDGALAPRDAARLRELLDEVPGLEGLGVVVGGGAGRRYVAAAGPASVDGKALHLTLKAHVLSFFQGNRFLVGALAEEVGRLVGGGGTLVDLYGGVGLFSLSLASRFETVVCVEGDSFAAADAEVNARTLGLPHVKVVRADVGRALSSLAQLPGERVVLDPPRTGAAPDVVRAIAARSPEVVVYVSCDPPTLARDLRLLVSCGYRLAEVKVLDMFPGTFHVETVARLVREP